MHSRRRLVAVVATVTLSAVGAVAAVSSQVEPAPMNAPAVLPRERAAVRASAVIDAAERALADGDTLGARARLRAAFEDPTLDSRVTYRIARLAESLADAGLAARAYRRYLGLDARGDDADTVRRRLLALVAGAPIPSGFGATVERSAVVARVTSAGEVGRSPKAGTHHRAVARRRHP